MIEMLMKLLKEPKVLVGISAVLNVALVVMVLHVADGIHVKFGETEVIVKTLTLDEHVEALFRQPTQRSQVRAMLEQEHFFEIGPDNPRAEAIALALVNLADRQSAHALVSELRNMSRRLAGPFKGLERHAKIVAKNDSHGVSPGIAQVCLGSGFEDMYLTIWGAGAGNFQGVTVHAEQQRDCPESMRDVVALHVDDWNVLFEEKDPAAKRPVIVRLHPPRVELKVDAQHRQALGVIPVAN